MIPNRTPVFMSAALALLAGSLHGQALAQARSSNAETDGAWGLGLAMSTGISPYRGADSNTRVIPFFTYESRRVRVTGPGVELKLGTSWPVAVGLTASYGFEGYKAGDSAFLAGMNSRKGSVWLGARAALRTEPATLFTEWSADASGHSHGQRLRLGVERRFSAGPIGVTPRVAATWHDARYVQYYYGVQAAEALPGRPAYSPGGAVNPEAGLRLDWGVAPRQILFADLGVTRLGSSIRQSPLVDRGSLAGLRLGYLHQF